MPTPDSFEHRAIGRVRTPYPEKFGAPRQPGLVPAARGRVELSPEFSPPEAFAELDGFSHLWLVFVFDQVTDGEWHPTVRPPRLGGNRRVGVFASRSPFRPNRIGLSAVKIESIDAAAHAIEISGVDLVDGTPLIDIKPYIPYCDAIADAKCGYADAPRPPLADFSFEYSPATNAAIDRRTDGDSLRELLEQTLRADPRPAYHDDPDKVYGMALADCEVRWMVGDGVISVETLEPRD